MSITGIYRSTNILIQAQSRMISFVFPKCLIASCDDRTALTVSLNSSFCSGLLRRRLDCPQNNSSFFRSFYTKPYLSLSKGIHENPRNENVKARTVLLIDDQGEQLGTMTLEGALDTAKDKSLHLVQIQKQQGFKPAICKLYSPKMIFESEKRAKHGSLGSPKLKEVVITGRIAPQDLKWKIKKIYDFLEHGNSVKLSITKKPYQKISHEEKMEIVKKVIEEVKEVGSLEGEPKVIGALKLRCNFKPVVPKGKAEPL